MIKRDPATAEIIAIIEQILGCGRLTAVTLMRKLITIINARIRDALQTPTPRLS